MGTFENNTIQNYKNSFHLFFVHLREKEGVKKLDASFFQQENEGAKKVRGYVEVIKKSESISVQTRNQYLGRLKNFFFAFLEEEEELGGEEEKREGEKIIEELNTSTKKHFL